MTLYLLDANIFIQAKNHHYGFDFCPAFWEWLIENNSKGKVASIKEVGDELQAGNDKLVEWAKERGDTFFLPPDDAVNSNLAIVSDYAVAQNKPAAIQDFLESADHWLIAHALAHNHIVVTHEGRRPGAKKIIKIPDVCDALGIPHRSPFEMLRRERARFVLPPDREAA